MAGDAPSLWIKGGFTLRVFTPEDQRGRDIVVDRPYALVGRVKDATLKIDDPSMVSNRHAYLHLDRRGLFAVDLASRTGTRVGRDGQASGWLEPGDALEVAGHRIELIETRVDPGADAVESGDPLDDAGTSSLVRVTLFQNRPPGPALVLGSELIFLGRSPNCGVQIEQAAVSRIHCVIVRRPEAAYLVDLVGKALWVNDRPVDGAKEVRDGDSLMVGPARFDVRVEPAGVPRSSSKNELSATLATSQGPPFRDAIFDWFNQVIQNQQNELGRVRAEYESEIERLKSQARVDRTVPEEIEAWFGRLDSLPGKTREIMIRYIIRDLAQRVSIPVKDAERVDRPDANAAALATTRSPNLGLPPDLNFKVNPDLDAAYLASRFQPGQIVFNRYVVQRKLGHGGMGSVWLVKHRVIEEISAIKVIVSRITHDDRARIRFMREAKIMAAFKHPNAVAILDAQLTDDDFTCYIEMEYIEGKAVSDILKGRPMSVSWIADVLDQLCDVLDAAHKQNIIHRDIKPSNIMILDEDASLKVLDFGLAKMLTDSDLLLGPPPTRSNDIIGTPEYASPEQISGDADTRSDIYSVGVVLYEFLTGQRPFTGSPYNVIYRVGTELPPTFAQVSPGVEYPPMIEELVRACLEKSPINRPQTILDVSKRFRIAIAGVD